MHCRTTLLNFSTMDASAAGLTYVAIFWFSLVGALAASFKHFFSPVPTIGELTPVALRDEKGKKTALPEVVWWGGFAFSAMNLGFASIGLWGAFKDSTEIKQAYLLGTAVLFFAFSSLWFSKGSMTGNPNPTKQAFKIAVLGLVFLFGFACSFTV